MYLLQPCLQVCHTLSHMSLMSPRYLTTFSFPICFSFTSKSGTKLQFMPSMKHFVGLSGRFFFLENKFIRCDNKTSLALLFVLTMSSTKAKPLMVVSPITAPPAPCSSENSAIVALHRSGPMTVPCFTKDLMLKVSAYHHRCFHTNFSLAVQFSDEW